MKRIAFFTLAFMMLLSFAACAVPADKAQPTEPPAPTEPPTPTEPPMPTDPPAPTEPPTPTEPPASDDDSFEAFVTGGVDFCMELELGKTCRFDLDGDELGDKVVYNNDIEDAPYWGYPYLRVTFSRFPDAPCVWRAPFEVCTIRVVDSFPEEPGLEIIEFDLGDSYDPESYILVPDYSSNSFMEIYGPGVLIDDDHPFSSENGFSVTNWTNLLGTCLIDGAMRLNPDRGLHLELVGEYVYSEYYNEQEYTLKQKLDVNLLNEDGSLGDKLTLNKGDKFRAYSTDNETYLTVRLSDGRLARVGIELGDWSVAGDYPDMSIFPWYIGGVLQDLLLEGIFYSG